jgi:hypothetical protein
MQHRPARTVEDGLGAIAVAATGWPHGLFTAVLIAIAFFIEKHL